MLPLRLLRHEFTPGRVKPLYLDSAHADLVRALLRVYRSHEGRTLRELRASLDGESHVAGWDRTIASGLRRVLDEFVRLEVTVSMAPRLLRRTVFGIAGGAEDLDPPQVLARAAEALEIPAIHPDDLYADLQAERRVLFPKALPDVEEVVRRYNFRLVQGLVVLADRVRVSSDGQFRAIYRLAKLHGLIVEVQHTGGECRGGRQALERDIQGGRDAPAGEPAISPQAHGSHEPDCAARGSEPILEITGPISLFRQTRRYGRALAAFLPACTLGRTYRIEASIVLSGRRMLLVITEADNVLSPHREPRPFDSRVEEQFARDFAALGSRWDIVREGDLIPVGRTVFIPDFTFRLREAPARCVHLEIIGFWTRDYLVRKQSLTRALGPGRIILCVDEKLCCDRAAWRSPCLPYSGRIDACRVLEALEGVAG